jgi:hypothetical protein
MTALIYTIIILAAGGMFFGMIKDRQGFAWGKVVTIVCAVIALVFALSTFFRSGGRTVVNVMQLENREMAFARIVGQRLGMRVAEKVPNARVLVIHGATFNEFAEQRLAAQLEGLKEGLGDNGEVIDAVELPIPQEFRQMMADMSVEGMEGPPPVSMEMMVYTNMSAADFNQIFDKQLDSADVVVSLVGLPVDLQNLSIWRLPEPPKVLAMSTMQIPQIQEYITGGYVIGLVYHRPDPDMTDMSVPKDVSAFDKIYLLITPENLEEVSKRYDSQLFYQY